MSEQGTAPEAPETAPTEGAAVEAPPAAFDPTPILQGMEGLRGQLDELRGAVTPAPEPEAEPEEDLEFDPAWFDQTDPNFDPADAQRRIAETMQQQIARAAQQAAGPAQQALERVMAGERRARAAALAGEYPELQQRETAQVVYDGSHEIAQDIASDLGLDTLGLTPQVQQEIVARIGDSPALWRASYLATKGRDAATAEADSEDPGHAHVEGGSGPGPAPSGEDLAQSIAASGGRRVLPY